MQYIRWPWNIFTANDGMCDGALQRNPDTNLGYQRTSKSNIDALRGSDLQVPSSPYQATSGAGRNQPDIVEEDTDLTIDATLVAPETPDVTVALDGHQISRAPEAASAPNRNNERVDPQTTGMYSSDYETQRRRTEQTSDIFPKLMNSLDRIEACLKEMIRQNQQQESLPQDIVAECSIPTTRELAGKPDNSVERLRDILGDEASIPTRRISLGAPSPDNSHFTVEPDIPLVNAVHTAETMAREQSDNLQAQTERFPRPGSAPPWQSNVDPRAESPTQDCGCPRTLRVPQGQSHDRSSSHVPSVDALPGVETDRRATSTSAGRREARIDDSNIAYYSPDPTANHMMDRSSPPEEINDGQFSSHSILNTPAPRTPITETSTPVRFSGFGLPASFSGDRDFAYTDRRSPSQFRWHRSVSSRHSTHGQPDFTAPATGIPDLMMQTLRDLHTAQLAAIDQQRESVRFMRELNERLERDLHDRRIETQRFAENFNQLRDYITRPGPPFGYPGSQAQPFIMAPYLPCRHS